MRRMGWVLLALCVGSSTARAAPWSNLRELSVTAGGGAVGATAAIPGIGTLTSFGLSSVAVTVWSPGVRNATETSATPCEKDASAGSSMAESPELMRTLPA